MLGQDEGWGICGQAGLGLQQGPCDRRGGPAGEERTRGSPGAESQFSPDSSRKSRDRH